MPKKKTLTKRNQTITLIIITKSLSLSLSLSLSRHSTLSAISSGSTQSLDSTQGPQIADESNSLLVARHIFGGQRENSAYEFVSASPAVVSMFCSAYLDRLWHAKQMAEQLLFCRVLLLEFFKDSAQHSCLVIISLFFSKCFIEVV